MKLFLITQSPDGLRISKGYLNDILNVQVWCQSMLDLATCFTLCGEKLAHAWTTWDVLIVLSMLNIQLRYCSQLKIIKSNTSNNDSNNKNSWRLFFMRYRLSAGDLRQRSSADFCALASTLILFVGRHTVGRPSLLYTLTQVRLKRKRWSHSQEGYFFKNVWW